MVKHSNDNQVYYGLKYFDMFYDSILCLKLFQFTLDHRLAVSALLEQALMIGRNKFKKKVSAKYP